MKADLTCIHGQKTYKRQIVTTNKPFRHIRNCSITILDRNCNFWYKITYMLPFSHMVFISYDTDSQNHRQNKNSNHAHNWNITVVFILLIRPVCWVPAQAITNKWIYIICIKTTNVIIQRLWICLEGIYVK